MSIVDRIALRSRVKDRYYTLAEEAQQVIDILLTVDGTPDAVIDDVRLLRATEAYFLVNEAYKTQFAIKQTEPPKIAAMTALTLAMFQPIQAADKNNVRSRNTKFANELFSLSWAARPLGQDFGWLIEKNLRKDGLKRYASTLKGMTLPCLDEYRADLLPTPPKLKDRYDIKLDHDTTITTSALSSLPAIEQMILLFELIWDGKGRMSD